MIGWLLGRSAKQAAWGIMSVVTAPVSGLVPGEVFQDGKAIQAEADREILEEELKKTEELIRSAMKVSKE